MWPFTRKPKESKRLPIFFTNTLGNKKQVFIPIKPGLVTMYSCGPTVYSRAHIGNLRSQIFSDLIARTLQASGYYVRRVINITDVDDKIEAAAKEEGRPAKELTEHYAKLFLRDISALNIETHDILFPRATEYIKEQIGMVQELEKKGFTYRTHDGIYFDTSTSDDYGKLGGISEAELKSGDAASLEDRISIAAGRRIAENKEKRHPADFALWKFSPAGSRHLEWSSPWGRGFPGWHIECSSMIGALLGKEIDIHTGGMDLIAIHHNNEIAQSEGVFGKPFVRTWIHGALLNIGNDKVSKSLKNDFSLADVTEQGIHPLALRYFFLQAHYRSPLSFSWEALTASNEALQRLWRLSATIADEAKGMSVRTQAVDRLQSLLNDDLGTPQALAYLWECLRDDEILPKEKIAIIEAAEPVLGLNLLNPPESARKRTVDELPEAIQNLVLEREKARTARDFEKADQLRDKLRNRGYLVEDGPNGPLLTATAK